MCRIRKKGGHENRKKIARALEKFKKAQETIKKLMVKALQEVLEAEMEEFLGYAKYEREEKNIYRNGYSSKTLKTSLGEIEIKTGTTPKNCVKLRIKVRNIELHSHNLTNLIRMSTNSI